MSSGCCKDAHVTVKLTDNHKTTSQLTLPGNNLLKHFSPVVSVLVSKPFSLVEAFDFANYHSPPFKSKQPVYLAYSVFRI